MIPSDSTTLLNLPWLRIYIENTSDFTIGIGASLSEAAVIIGPVAICAEWGAH